MPISYCDGVVFRASRRFPKEKNMQPTLATRLISPLKSKMIAAAILATPLFLPADASATNRTWLGGIGTGNWNTPALWTGGVLPNAADDTFIVNTDTQTRTVVQNAGNVTTLNLHVNNTTGIGNNIVFLPTNAGLNTFLQELGTTGKGEFVNSGGFNSVNPAGSFSSAGLMLGTTVNGRGVYTLTNGGNLSVNAATLGNQSNTKVVIGQAGFGTFVQNGGRAEIGPSITLGDAVGGTGFYSLSGDAILNVGSSAFVTLGNAGGGTFQQGGTSYASMPKLILASQPGSYGVYNISGGNLNIQANSGDAVFDLGSNGAGTVNQTGGSVYYTAARAGQAGLNIGLNASGAGTYLLSGNNSYLNTYVIDERIGYGGPGTFIQNGATHQAEAIYVGYTASGRYALGGGGTIAVSQALSVQNGSMTQSSGFVTVGNRNPLLGTITFGQMSTTGQYQLQNGTLDVNGLELVVGLDGLGSGTGLFEQTGGVHKVNGVLFLGGLGDVVIPNIRGTYLLSGGRLEVTPAAVTLSGNFNGGDNSMHGLELDAGGTIVGGATDGVFAGKMTQQGGTIAGTFRNEGQIVSKGGTITGTLLNRNHLTMESGTLTVGSLAISNEAGALIDGAGAILGTVNNIGSIVPTGALSISVVNNTTPATIHIGLGTSLNSAFIDNFNTIRLDGGSLRGLAGQVRNNGNPANGGALISGGGTIEPELIVNGGIVRADLPGVPLVIKAIDIEDPSSQFIVAQNCTLNIQPNFTNGVPISLQGSGARLLGGTITNPSGVTIKGGGQIVNRVLNSGVIRAEGGSLALSGVSNTNAPGGLLQAGTGNTLSFTSGLANNQGIIQLTGGEFDNNGFALTNSGAVTGRGTVRAGSVNNTGSMLFSGGITDVFGAVMNNSQITVTGNGAATFYNNFSNVGAGNFTVTLGSTAVFLGSISGLSTISGPGTKDFEATASAGAISATGTTIVGPLANVTANSVRDNTVDLHGRMAIVPNGSASAVSRVGSLLIDGAAVPVGTLNLNNNDLILTSTSKTLTQSQIAFARHGGAWDRAGITSGAAASASPKNTMLGVLSGQQYRSVYGPSATFDTFTVADSDVLVKYTWYGDSDFNGIVNFDDYARIDAGFNSQATGGSVDWFRGDFDLNNTVNFDDYALLDLAFNTQSGTLREAMTWLEGKSRSQIDMSEPSLQVVVGHFEQFGNPYVASFLNAVPEPAAIGSIGLLALTATTRRRRKIAR
ncbi:hypothetical protein BH09PLA1_BH09PLA1_08350 [soil metagenome]